MGNLAELAALIDANNAAITVVTGQPAIFCPGYVGYLPIGPCVGLGECNCSIRKPRELVFNLFGEGGDGARVVVLMDKIAAMAGVAAIPYTPPVDTSIEAAMTAFETYLTDCDTAIATFIGKLDGETGHTADVIAATGDKLYKILNRIEDQLLRLKTGTDALLAAVT